MRRENRKNMVQTESVTPKIIQRLETELRLRNHIKWSPRLCIAVIERGRPVVGYDVRRLIRPSEEYGEYLAYRGSNRVSKARNALWSKPHAVMSDWSQPEPNIVANAERCGSCREHRVNRR